MYADGEVTIRDHSLWAAVTGADMAVISAALTTTEYGVAHGKGKVGLRKYAVRAYRLRSDGAIIIHSGHIDRVAAALRRAGHCVRIARGGTFGALVAANRRVAEMNLVPTPLQRKLLSTPRGRIAVHNLRQAAAAIAELAELHPTTKIPVITADNQTLHELAGHLRRLTSRVRIQAEREYGDPHDIVLRTTWAHWGPQMHRYFDVAIYVGLQAATQYEVLETLLTLVDLQPHRGDSDPFYLSVLRYLIVLPGRRLTQWEDLHVEAAFGSVIGRFVTPDRRQGAAEVAWMLCPRTPRESADTSGVMAENIDHRRLRRIARLASAVRDGDISAAASLGCDADRLARHFAGTDRRPPIAILVAAPAHARAVQAMLRPAWPILTADSPIDVRLCTSIVTESHALAYGIAADVVIRADGVASPLDPGLLRRDGRRVRLVIDTADGGEETARRREKYIDYGYRVDPPPRIARDM